ncbi:MAG: nitrogen fixation protein NifS [Verrucomicrobia bacterium]|nr:nitrogen fixation protein NifS [Verrucomicrobiota bacterium]
MPALAANPAEKLFEASLLEAIRSRFLHADRDPFSGARVYFENAGGGLTLRSVFDADLKYSSLPDNAGRENAASSEIGRVLRSGRADVATFLNARDGAILCDQSTTSCAFRILSAAVAGIRGTNLVCSTLDHASFYDAAKFLADRHGLERRVVPLNRKTGALDADTFAAQVDSGTVAVSIIHASNITGGQSDLNEVVRQVRARAPQAIIVADGAQHTQHCLVDVAASGVDAYVFSAYKVFSKPGLAFAYLSPRLTKLPHAQLLGKPAADWDLGTRDPGGFAAFTCVVDYLSWLGTQADASISQRDRRSQLAAGMQAIAHHEAALSRRLLEGVEGLTGLARHPRVTLHGQRDPVRGREAVFAFTIEGLTTGEIVQQFGNRGVIVHDRVTDAYSGHTLTALGVPEVVRVSLAHYNTPQEVETFLRVLAEIVARP